MRQSDSEAFHQAIGEIDAGHPEQAEPELRELAAKYPANDQVNEALGLIYAEKGEMVQALPYLDRACKDAPQSALDHANLGTTWLKLSRPRDAVRELRLGAALDAQNAGTLSNLGQAYMLLGDAANAAHAFAQAARLDPQNLDLLYNWAVALNQMGQADRAAKVLDRIPDTEKSDQAESLAGDVEEKLGHFLPAEQHYEKAAKKNASEANLFALCVELLRHWTWDQAAKTAAYGMAKYPQSARLKMAYGVSLYGSKQFSAAAQAFGNLLSTDPDNNDYAEMLGRTCAELQAGTGNCSALVSFASRHPDNPSAGLYAAREILEQPHSTSDLTHAEQLLASVTRMKPTLAEAWYELGLIDAERMQWRESARMFAKATALRPAYASAHYQLAQAYAHLGRPELRKKELALFQACSQKEQDEVNARVRAMTVFLSAGAAAAHE